MTDLQIANLTLTSLGADTITSFTEDSEPARKVSTNYNHILNAMLREHPWNFAIKRVKLDLATSALTGSIDPTASTAVVGVGTLFTTELVTTNMIKVNSAVRTVDTITDNTHLTVTLAFDDDGNDTSPEKLTTPAFGYTYFHNVPTDSLRILNIYNGTDETDDIEDFKVEQAYIASDEETLYARYIFLPSTSAISIDFAIAFSTRLAAEIAWAITNSAGMVQNMFNLYQDKLRIAKINDAQESGKTIIQGEDEWLESRV